MKLIRWKMKNTISSIWLDNSIGVKHLQTKIKLYKKSSNETKIQQKNPENMDATHKFKSKLMYFWNLKKIIF